MSESFIGEIRIVGFNFAPKGWAYCNGQVIPITQNTALFSLLGTQYGGDGKLTFALPNLQARVPVDAGQGPGLSARTMGEQGGAQTVTLSSGEMPAHTHAPVCAAVAGGKSSPQNATWAPVGGRGAAPAYTDAAADLTLSNEALFPVIGAQSPHNNMQPFLMLNFVIAMQGIYPMRP